MGSVACTPADRDADPDQLALIASNGKRNRNRKS